MNSPDKHLEQRARELWRSAAQHVDPATAGRLRAARRTALEARQAPTHRTARWLIPAGACAVIALATLMVWQPLPGRHAEHVARPAATTAESSVDFDNDLPPDADKTDPNLYQNLDFYGWLAANGNQTAQR